VGEDFREYVSLLKDVLKKKNVIFFQIEPIEDISCIQWVTQDRGFFRYRRFITRQTRVLYLENTTDTLLSDMHEKGRYNIRLAEKRGVIVKKVSLTSEVVDIWMNLLNDTTDRDGFSHNNRRYYESFILSLEQKNE